MWLSKSCSVVQDYYGLLSFANFSCKSRYASYPTIVIIFDTGHWTLHIM